MLFGFSEFELGGARAEKDKDAPPPLKSSGQQQTLIPSHKEGPPVGPKEAEPGWAQLGGSASGFGLTGCGSSL